MIPKYTIEFAVPFAKQAQPHHYSTDDPVTCEEFTEELLERGFPIHAIKHEGVNLPKHEFDRIVKTAASMMTAKHICSSLAIKPDEERFRFGFTA